MRLGLGGTATPDKRGAGGTSKTYKGMTTEFHKKSVGPQMHSAITENRHCPGWPGSSLNATSRGDAVIVRKLCRGQAWVVT